MASRLWTTERIGAVQRLWADGKTAVEIAAVLDGVSRSAVLGMIFRLRLGADGKNAPANASKPSKPGKSRAATPALVKAGPGPYNKRHRSRTRVPRRERVFTESEGASMYPEMMLTPMRQELTAAGIKEVRTAEAVDAAIAQPGTTLLVVNSICGCAAGKMRPGVRLGD